MGVHRSPICRLADFSRVPGQVNKQRVRRGLPDGKQTLDCDIEKVRLPTSRPDGEGWLIGPDDSDDFYPGNPALTLEPAWQRLWRRLFRLQVVVADHLAPELLLAAGEGGELVRRVEHQLHVELIDELLSNVRRTHRS